MNSTKLLGITVFFLFHTFVCPAQSTIRTPTDSLNTYNPIMHKYLQVFKGIREKVNSGLYYIPKPEGRGVIPDYKVWPRLDDFIAQKDTQMNFVLELIEKSD